MLLNVGDHAIQVETLRFRNRLRLEDGRDDYLIGKRQAAGQSILQHVAAHGVGARLEYHPQARLRITRPQGVNRLLDGGRMMRKIVDDRDAVDFRLHFQPALHAAKSLQRFSNRIFRNSVARRQRCGGGRIPDVVFSAERKLEIRPGLSIADHRP